MECSLSTFFLSNLMIDERQRVDHKIVQSRVDKAWSPAPRREQSPSFKTHLLKCKLRAGRGKTLYMAIEDLHEVVYGKQGVMPFKKRPRAKFLKKSS